MASRLIDCFAPLKITPEKWAQPGVRRGRFPGWPTIAAGADTVVLDVNVNRLGYLDDIFGSRITPVYSDAAQIAHVQRELQGRGLTAIAAATATGARLRLGLD